MRDIVQRAGIGQEKDNRADSRYDFGGGVRGSGVPAIGGIKHPAQHAWFVALRARRVPIELDRRPDPEAWGARVAVTSPLVAVFLFKETRSDTVRVSSKGPIVIPKALHEAKPIKPGTDLAIAVIGDEIRSTVAVATPATRVREAAGILARPGRRRLTRGEILTGFTALLSPPNFEPAQTHQIRQALAWYREGLDFADALDVAFSGGDEGFVSFDRALAKLGTKLVLHPSAVQPPGTHFRT